MNIPSHSIPSNEPDDWMNGWYPDLGNKQKDPVVIYVCVCWTLHDKLVD